MDKVQQSATLGAQKRRVFSERADIRDRLTAKIAADQARMAPSASEARRLNHQKFEVREERDEPTASLADRFFSWFSEEPQPTRSGYIRIDSPKRD